MHQGALIKEVPYIEETMHVLANGMYSHHSRSPQKTRGLLEMASSMDTNLLKLQRFLEVRFVESSHKMFKALLHDMPVLVVSLERELSFSEDNGGPEPGKRLKMRGWVNAMKQFKFVCVGLVVLDLHTITRKFSKQVQSNSAFILDLPRFREELFDGLEVLVLGDNLKGGAASAPPPLRLCVSIYMYYFLHLNISHVVVQASTVILAELAYTKLK